MNGTEKKDAERLKRWFSIIIAIVVAIAIIVIIPPNKIGESKEAMGYAFFVWSLGLLVIALFNRAIDQLDLDD